MDTVVMVTKGTAAAVTAITADTTVDTTVDTKADTTADTTVVTDTVTDTDIMDSKLIFYYKLLTDYVILSLFSKISRFLERLQLSFCYLYKKKKKNHIILVINCTILFVVTKLFTYARLNVQFFFRKVLQSFIYFFNVHNVKFLYAFTYCNKINNYDRYS